MTAQQITALFVRLFAIWIALTAIQAMGVNFAQGIDLNKSNLVIHVFTGLSILVAGLLWKYPLLVAHLLIPGKVQELTPTIQPKAALAAGCAILGVWFACESLPIIISTVSQVFISADAYEHKQFVAQYSLWLITALIRFFVACFLLLKPWWVASKVFDENI